MKTKIDLVNVTSTPQVTYDAVHQKYDVIMIARRPETSNPAFDELCEKLNPVVIQDFRNWDEIKSYLKPELPVVFAGGSVAVVEAVAKASLIGKRGLTRSVKIRSALIYTISDISQLRSQSRYLTNVHLHCMKMGIDLFISCKVLDEKLSRKAEVAVVQPNVLSFNDFLEKKLIKVLAMMTAGKSHLLESAKNESWVIGDTDLNISKEAKKTLRSIKDSDDYDIYAVGAFIKTCYLLYVEYTKAPDGNFMLLTNLWYRDITAIVKFDIAVNVIWDVLAARQIARGSDPIDEALAKKYSADASEFYPIISKKFILLKKDEYLSDVVKFDDFIK